MFIFIWFAGRGDPTQSLSCSDKLAKWCYLGVQGAILTLLLEAPVYINTFIMSKNSPYCEEAIHRALFDRFGPVNLEYPYKQNKIILGQSSLDFKFSKKPDKSPCPSSIIWCKTNYRYVISTALYFSLIMLTITKNTNRISYYWWHKIQWFL